MIDARDEMDYGMLYTVLRNYLERVVVHYERSAPAVSRWADDVYIRVDEDADQVTLSEIMFAYRLYSSDEGWMDANYAANSVYKLLHRLGRDTTGLAGF